MNRGDFGGAERALTLSLAYSPAHPESNRLLGILLLQLGRDQEAIDSFREAAKTRPGDASIAIPLARAQADADDINAALLTLRELVSTQSNVTTLSALARMLSRSGNLQEAICVDEAVLALDAGQTRIRLQYGLNLFHCGRTDEASAQFRQLIEEGHELANAWFALAEMKTLAFDGDDSVALRALCTSPRFTGVERARLLHALGRACEDNQNWPAAFDAFGASARLMHTSAWTRDLLFKQIQILQTAFAQPVAAPQPTLGEEVVFIVGMPRSGSTLIEQILAAHPAIQGGSELVGLPLVLQAESRRRGVPFPQWVPAALPSDWQRLGHNYLARTARWRVDKPRFTDKFPDNWVMAEAALAMLPGARLIDCRREPLEMLWSCFKQSFAPGLASWSYTFEDIVNYWKACSYYCDYLAARYPDRVRIQSHERLLEDPAGQTRELLTFCGLEFDPACLRFYEATRIVRTPSAAQVRQPIRRGVSASERYGELLDPLRRLIVS